jgi:hypothetical protein
MLIVFTGHRDRLTNPEALQAIEAQYPCATWMHGGAKGFDTQVHGVALALGKSIAAGTLVVVRPEYGRYHASVAPLRRNEVMVDQADIVYACFDGRQRGGTYATIRYAKRNGKEVVMLECATPTPTE